MQPLPIGTQDFPKLVETGLLYVDKTALIHGMILEGSVYFLSRPRWFGKSLLVSTLRTIFEGRCELCTGLAIEALPYDWSPHPVMHLDFGAERFASPIALQAYISDELDRFSAIHGVGPEGQTATARFRHALRTLSNRGTRTVVLIDEHPDTSPEILPKHLLPDLRVAGSADGD